MNFVKTLIVVIIAGGLFAGCASASSVYSAQHTTTSNSQNISQQMTNVISKNVEAINHQLNK